jgi:acyl carrier protein
MTRTEGLATIARQVADSLALDVAGVAPTSRLVTDLGADSLDFFDLLFALEKAFGVKIRESELDFLAKLDVTSPEALKDGFLLESL